MPIVQTKYKTYLTDTDMSGVSAYYICSHTGCHRSLGVYQDSRVGCDKRARFLGWSAAIKPLCPKHKGKK